MRAAALLACSAAALAAAQTPLAIERCAAGFAPETFAVQADGSVQQPSSGQCIISSAGNVVVGPCAAGDGWTWNSDGTVESVAQPGQCWNVDGGSTASGTGIILYACGSLRAGQGVARNDVFAWLPAEGHILANESGLCVSTAAPPTPPPGSCQSDIDCNLNGVCNTAAGKCVCDAPWTGSADCGALAFVPAPTVRGYGMTPNVTSWGGSVVEHQGLYHMYVAEMVNDCPLSTWGQNSRVTHAVASDPLGPFVQADVALIPWAHNPAVVKQVLPDGSAVFALFHIGDATGSNTKNCTPSNGAAGLTADGSSDVVIPAPLGAQGSTLHVATSPYGPWTPVQPSPPSCNNPAPWLHSNGTFFLVCNGFELWRAPSYTGPWTQVTTISAGGGVAGVYEDPFLFVDARGNWHVIYHVYRTDAGSDNCTTSEPGATVAGHYYSADGLVWNASPTEPYTNSVELDNGTVQWLSTRERPKILFNAAGVPTYLYNGVCGATTCPPTPCVNCKYDWFDFTNVVQLQL